MKGIIFTEDGVKCIFDEAEELENIQSGESVADIFGKIQKWFSETKNIMINNTLNKLLSEMIIVKDSIGMLRKNWIKSKTGTFTQNGITFTHNPDGSVTCNGTATKSTDYTLGRIEFPENTSFILSGCPGIADTYEHYYIFIEKLWTGHRYCDAGARFEFDTGSCKEWTAGIHIEKNQTVNDLTFYPMLGKASYDNSYAPYTDDLQTQINELKAQIAALTAANNTEE